MGRYHPGRRSKPTARAVGYDIIRPRGAGEDTDSSGGTRRLRWQDSIHPMKCLGAPGRTARSRRSIVASLRTEISEIVKVWPCLESSAWTKPWMRARERWLNVADGTSTNEGCAGCLEQHQLFEDAWENRSGPSRRQRTVERSGAVGADGRRAALMMLRDRSDRTADRSRTPPALPIPESCWAMAGASCDIEDCRDHVRARWPRQPLPSCRPTRRPRRSPTAWWTLMCAQRGKSHRYCATPTFNPGDDAWRIHDSGTRPGSS